MVPSHKLSKTIVALVVCANSLLFGQTPPFSRNPKVNFKINPKVNFNINPRVNFQISPKVNFDLNPKVNFDLNPSVNFEISPKVNFDLNPRVNFKINPRVNSEINPKVNLRVNPFRAGSGFDGYYLFSLDADMIGFFVFAERRVLVLYDTDLNWTGFAVGHAKGYNLYGLDGEWKAFLIRNSENGFNLFNLDGEWVGFAN